MSHQIDTDVIRRLRDALLAEGLSDAAQAADAIASRRDAALARVAPFAETMYLVMIADGHSTDEELTSVRGAIRILTQGLLNDADLEALLQRCDAAVSERGAAHLLQVLGGRLCANRSDRETAFTLAAAVAMADDDIAAEESEMIDNVAEWFGVSSRRAGELLGHIRKPAA